MVLTDHRAGSLYREVHLMVKSRRFSWTPKEKISQDDDTGYIKKGYAHTTYCSSLLSTPSCCLPKDVPARHTVCVSVAVSGDCVVFSLSFDLYTYLPLSSLFVQWSTSLLHKITKSKLIMLWVSPPSHLQKTKTKPKIKQKLQLRCVLCYWLNAFINQRRIDSCLDSSCMYPIL